MDNLQDIIRKIQDLTQPPPSPAEILECMEKYPYFSTLAMAWLKRTADEGMLYDAETRDRIALLAALATPGDTKEIQFRLADLSAGIPTDNDFYPPEDKPAQPDTEQTIDKFLSEYSSADQKDESAVIEQLIFNPVADYASVLEEEERRSLPTADEAEKGSDDDLINRFILKTKEEETPSSHLFGQSPSTPTTVPERKPVKKPVAANEETTFSESLAKIYIQRKNYSGAYEIINKLNLKFPEKSIYFAVQLRFLEKVILNERLKTQPDASVTNN